MATRVISPLTDQRLLTDRVYETLREAIFALELEPGSPLVERDLAARLGVSKSPVREALQRLAVEGLVTQSPYRGTTVVTIGPDEVDQIYALREVLEAFAVELATPRLTRADVERARQILARSEAAIESEDRALLAQVNREFHGLFGECSGNHFLAGTVASLQDRVRVISVMGWRSRPTMREEYLQHAAVLDAAATGDAGQAAAAMRDHIHRFRLAFELGRRDEDHDG